MAEPAPTLKDKVYYQVVELICAGEFPAGSRLTENKLIDRFGVSKSPVREALIQLCHDGVLQSIPRSGYEVVEVSAKSVHDLTELRMYIELGGLRNVMDNLTEPRIQYLKQLNLWRRRPNEEKTVWSAWDNNVKFHMSLVEYSGNQQAVAAMERIFATCTRAYAQLFAVQKNVMASENPDHRHDRITEALEYHEFHTAYGQLQEDIQFMEDQLLSSKIAK